MLWVIAIELAAVIFMLWGVERAILLTYAGMRRAGTVKGDFDS